MVTTYDYVSVTVGGFEVDRCRVSLPVEIKHGRSGISSQPDAPEISFVYLGDYFPGALGDPLELFLVRPVESDLTWQDPRADWTSTNWGWLGQTERSKRFSGTIAGLNAVEEGGVVTGFDVVATGVHADLGFIGIDIARPEETDVDRILAIAAAAGVTINVRGTPGVRLVPDAIERDALSAIHEVCVSSGGLFWQARDGGLWYGTATHRSTDASAVLPCTILMDGVKWQSDLELIINSVTVKWGDESPDQSSTGEWTLDTVATMADPTPGKMRTNAATSDAVTQMAVADLDMDGTDYTGLIRGLRPGSALYLQDKDVADNWARFQVTAPPVDNATWWQIAVSFISVGGAPVTKAQEVLLMLGSSSSAGVRQETFHDDPSIAEWGLRHVEISTQCADGDEAGLLALLVLARRKQPHWRMPEAMVDFETTTIAEIRALMDLEVSDGVMLPIPIYPLPVPAEVNQWTLEGWVESFGEDGHLMQLSVTDRKRWTAAETRSWGTADNNTWAFWSALSWIDQLVNMEV